MRPPFVLMAELMYGSELRLLECVSLRVKDVDLATRSIEVHDGKGMRDRITVLPCRCRDAVRRQIHSVRPGTRGTCRRGGAPSTCPLLSRRAARHRRATPFVSVVCYLAEAVWTALSFWAGK